MHIAPIPDFEEERLAALRRKNLLDTPSDPRFDALTKEAVERLHVPIATVSVIDAEREWFKSCQGIPQREGKRDISFCGHALLSRNILVVEDTLKDDRFKDNPYVIKPPYIRFYAGMPMYDRKTQLPLAVFCVKDTKPRHLTAEDIAEIFDLAKRASNLINENS